MCESVSLVRVITSIYMKLAGLQKTTLVDFPGMVAATVFTRGCSFRCGFCHNPELVIPEQFLESFILEEEFFDFLLSRVGKLQGVCITGGEPLLQPDIEQFISHIKALGFKVKLDTNGSFPDRLENIIKEGDIDYIAMDIKSSLPKYAMTISNDQFPISNENSEIDKLNENCKLKIENLIANIKRSIRLIMQSGIDYEFRTTVCHPYHKVADFKKIGQMIKGAKRYFIQNFVKSKQIDPTIKFEPFSDSELNQAKKLMSSYIKSVELR